MAPRDQMAKWFRELIDGGSPEFKAATTAGIPLDFTSEKTSTGLRMTATTRYPCAVVGNTVYYSIPKDSEVETDGRRD